MALKNFTRNINCLGFDICDAPLEESTDDKHLSGGCVSTVSSIGDPASPYFEWSSPYEIVLHAGRLLARSAYRCQ